MATPTIKSANAEQEASLAGVLTLAFMNDPVCVAVAKSARLLPPTRLPGIVPKSFYLRHGFDLAGAIHIGDFPPVFPMVRKPR